MKYLMSFVFLMITGAAQSNPIDSLQVLLDTAENQEVRVAAMNELAFLWLYKQPTESKKLAAEALALAEENQQWVAASYSLNVLGNLAMATGNLDDAHRFFQQVLDVRITAGDLRLIGYAHNSLGNWHRNRGNMVQAEAHYKDALSTLDLATESNVIALIYNNLSVVYRERGALEQAVHALEQSRTLYSQLGNTSGLANNALAFGGYFEATEQQMRAKKSYQQALKSYTASGDEAGQAKAWQALGNLQYLQQQPDSALIYFHRSLAVLQAVGLDRDVPLLYNNIGLCLASLQRSDEAREYFERALNLCIEFNNIEGQVEALLNLSDVAMGHGATLEGMQHGQSALIMASTHQLVLLSLQAMKRLSTAYEQLNELDSALHYAKQYQQTNDTLAERFRSVVAMQFQLDQAKTERAEALQTLREQQARANRKRLYLWGLVGLLLLGVIAASSTAFALFQRKQRVEVQKVQQAKELESLQALLQMQDKERKRIARDLHDKLGSTLSWVKLTFQHTQEKIDLLQEETGVAYQKAVDTLDDAVELIREIAHDLDSGVLKKFGFVAAVHELVNTLQESTRLKIEFDHSGLDERPETEVEEACYKIVQELFNNILKHANANHISIQLLRNNGNLNILVEDDGVGFDAAAASYTAGLGLKNIDSRLHALNGTIAIDSMLNRGTITNINIPIAP